MGNALFLNDGQGRFRNVTEEAGLAYRRQDGHPGEARQPLIADFDNDGLQDIFISYAHDAHRLYRNLGEGRFEDVTEHAGLGGEGLIGGPATTLDFDRDGLLDIYIGYFGDYLAGALPEHDNIIADPSEGPEGGKLPTLARNNLNALANKLFRNMGDMAFEDVTEASGTGQTGWAQAVTHTDFDGDGWQDIIVANDFGKNCLFHNNGDGTFTDLSDSLGVEKAYHSMNVGIADLNDDTYPDIYFSNITSLNKDPKYFLPDALTQMNLDLRIMASMRYKESNILYLSRRERQTLQGYDISEALQRGTGSDGWAWDADFFDFDNDGDDDLYLVNGTHEYYVHTFKFILEYRGEESVKLLSHDRESNVFLVNEGGELRNESLRSGADLVLNSRAAAYLDYDGDGDLDIAINNFHAPAVFLRNNAEKRGNHWVKVRLIGDVEKGCNRDAIGARLYGVTPGGHRLWREVHGGTGYLSMDPKEQHFGLGAEEGLDLKIVWPNGDEQEIKGLAAGRAYVIEQGHDPIEKPKA